MSMGDLGTYRVVGEFQVGWGWGSATGQRRRYLRARRFPMEAPSMWLWLIPSLFRRLQTPWLFFRGQFRIPHQRKVQPF